MGIVLATGIQVETHFPEKTYKVILMDQDKTYKLIHPATLKIVLILSENSSSKICRQIWG